MNGMSWQLTPKLAKSVAATVADWQCGDKVRRLWAHDSSLWTNADEGKWMGWLDIVEQQIAQEGQLLALQAEVKAKKYTHALLLGMGGSSLCPEVTAMTFGKQPGFPKLLILDSVDPAQIRTVESKIDYKSTLFIVASKSGSTLEPNIFKQYFFTRCQQECGEAGSRFIAITDPGSKMQQVAEFDKFAHIFYGLPTIGGRYSALSNFGMVPLAVAGVNVKKFLQRTQQMVDACGAAHSAEDNPGARLGALLGTLAKQERDKLTVFASPGISDIGSWMEQLIAESTGKIGKGIIPVDRESIGSPAVYGKDRVFAYMRLKSKPDPQQDRKIAALAKAGHPVVRIDVDDIYNIGQEYFRWEFATAVAGAVIGIHPFNQPDVEASKNVTRELTSAYEASGKLPDEKPIFADSGLKLFTDEKNAKYLFSKAKKLSLAALLAAHFGRAKAGDYVGLLAYLEMNAAHETSLQAMRHRIRDKKKVATVLGFGPRFLHSTGQAYKGGPNSGVFLQITCDDARDLAVPGQKYTFGTVKAAQARGDFEVLIQRDRRALRIHLPADVDAGLRKLAQALALVVK